MFNKFNPLIFQFVCILSFIVLFIGLIPNLVLAESVVSMSLNDLTVDAKINPTINDSVIILITTNIPVKFNTIAICKIDDTTCSRSTTVKYFTQTSSYSTIVEKSWDGQKSGSGGPVEDGEYKVKVTMVAEGDSNIFSEEINSPLILADASFEGNEVADEEEEEEAETDDEVDDNSLDNASTHSGSQALSTNIKKAKLEIDAGRLRLTTLGIPVNFEAEVVSSDSLTEQIEFEWSFGDATSLTGAEVEHLYRYPGRYQVVLNAEAGKVKAVDRTEVLVVPSELVILATTTAWGEGLEVINDSNWEINIGDCVLTDGLVKFEIPTDTILLSKQSLIIDQSIWTKLASTTNDIELNNQAGEVLTKINDNEKAEIALSTLEEIEEIKNKALKLAVILNNLQSQAKVKNQSTSIIKSIPLTPKLDLDLDTSVEVATSTEIATSNVIIIPKSTGFNFNLKDWASLKAKNFAKILK